MFRTVPILDEHQGKLVKEYDKKLPIKLVVRDDESDPNKAAARVQVMAEVVRRVGEPFLSSFNPHELEIELSQIGFQVREHLSPLEIGRKYFQERTEGQRACEHAHFVHAIVK